MSVPHQDMEHLFVPSDIASPQSVPGMISDYETKNIDSASYSSNKLDVADGINPSLSFKLGLIVHSHID